MLWLVPRLQKLAAHSVAVRYCFDFCQYGGRTVAQAHRGHGMALALCSR